MFVERAVSHHVKIILPGAVVFFGYAVFTAIPQQQEWSRLSHLIEEQTNVIENLDQRIQRSPPLTRRPDHSQVGMNQVVGREQLSTQDNMTANSKKTIVQSMSQVLEIFKTHGVRCTGTVPDEDVATTAKQRISMSGGFGDVLDAVAMIEKQLPGSVIVHMAMRRPDQSKTCAWDFDFRFAEDAE